MNKEKLEDLRKWVTTVVVLLILPVTKVVLQNERLESQAFVKQQLEGYVTKEQHQLDWRSWKEWSVDQHNYLDSEIKAAMLRTDRTEAKLDGLSIKMDAALNNQTTVLMQLHNMQKGQP